MTTTDDHAISGSPTDGAPRPRKRIKQLEVMVADVIPETHDTTTLVLFAGNDALEYRAGHFLTIDPHQFAGLSRWVEYLEDAKGRREPNRAYSLASSPHEKSLAITVKEERYVSGVTRYPPLLSPLLVNRLSRGTCMTITGFTGPYALPDDIEDRTEHLVHVCAGSGVVPNWSILKYALAERPGLKHTFVYGNKTWDDVIYRDALNALAAQHPERLRVVHTLSRHEGALPSGADVRTGRVTAELIAEALPAAADEVMVYACGPAIGKWDRERAKAAGEEPRPRFMETVLEALDGIGVPRERVKRESFG